MADRNAPPTPGTHREDSQPQADANPYAYDHDAAEDPLVELARIVGETGRAQPDTGPSAPYAAPEVAADRYAPAANTPAANTYDPDDAYLADPYAPDPQVPDLYAVEPPRAEPRASLPDDFADGLEAELMAELRPAYQEQPTYADEPVQSGAASPQAYAPADAVQAAPPLRAAPQTDYAEQGGYAIGRDTSFAAPQPQAAAPVPPQDPDYGHSDLYRVTPPAADPAPEPAFIPEPAVPDDLYAAPETHREPVFTHARAPAPSLSPAPSQNRVPSQNPAPRNEPVVSREPVYAQADESPAQVAAEAYAPPQDDVDDMSWPAAESAIAGTAGSLYDDRAPAQADDAFDDLFEPDVDFAPGEAPEHVLPPHSQAERAMAPAGKSSRRGLVVVGTVVAVAALGAGGFLISGLFGNDGPVGPAAVITADAGPFKVFPAEQSGDTATPSKAIYDRVGGVAAPRQEQLVSREEAPLATVPTTSGSQPRQVTGETSEPGEPVTANGLPRRVRTVVVRPDGTIINAPEEPETTPDVVAVNPLPETPAAGTAAPVTAPADSVRVPTVAVNSDAIPGDAGTNAAASDIQSAGTTVGVTPVEITPRPKPEGLQVAAAPVTTQPTRSDGPLDLSGGNQNAAVAPAQTQTQAPAAAAAAPVSVPAGAYIVQISSQRTREQAESSYAAMQQRYPSVLGGVPSVIQAADLGDRGIYYRVRVVAGSQGEANQLCERLKAAGGDCFVRRAQ